VTYDIPTIVEETYEEGYERPTTKSTANNYLELEADEITGKYLI